MRIKTRRKKERKRHARRMNYQGIVNDVLLVNESQHSLFTCVVHCLALLVCTVERREEITASEMTIKIKKRRKKNNRPL